MAERSFTSNNQTTRRLSLLFLTISLLSQFATIWNWISFLIGEAITVGATFTALLFFLTPRQKLLLTPTGLKRIQTDEKLSAKQLGRKNIEIDWKQVTAVHTHRFGDGSYISKVIYSTDYGKSTTQENNSTGSLDISPFLYGSENYLSILQKLSEHLDGNIFDQSTKSLSSGSIPIGRFTHIPNYWLWAVGLLLTVWLLILFL